MNINDMIFKYSIKMIGENIGVTAPKQNKNMEELTWIKNHKAEIIEELKKREAEYEAEKAAREKAYNDFAKIEPDIKKASNALQADIINKMITKGVTAEQILPYFRSLYADEWES